jgi:hypothetical protein
MSDFLSNLVARSCGQAELIRPRLTSLFEPPRAARSSALGPLLRPNALEEAEAFGEMRFEAAPPAPRPTIRATETQLAAADLKLPVEESEPGPADLLGKPNRYRRQPARQPSSSPTPTPNPSSDTSEELLPRFMSSPRHDPALRASSPVLSAFVLNPSEVAPLAAITPESAEAQPALSPVELPAKPKEQQRAAPLLVSPNLRTFQVEASVGQPKQPAPGEVRGVPVAAGDQDKSQPVGRQPGEQRQPAVKPPSRRASNQDVATLEERRLAARPESLSPHSARAMKVTMQPQVTHYRKQTTPGRAETMARPEPPTTIQVTIGRIEVRAAPPTAKPHSEKRSGPPVMSLDEYLRRRAKAGAR